MFVAGLEYALSHHRMYYSLSLTAVKRRSNENCGLHIIPMTHAPETGAINRLHFLAPVFGAGFSYHIRLE